MPNLLAMSFEGELAPSFTLTCLNPGRTLPDGWGLGYYPAGEPSAAILKEPAPPQASMRSQLALAWEQVASNVFMLHIRAATWGALSDANTQPFSRAWGRRDWLMAHAGSLDRKPEIAPGPFEPVGSTDTEAIFCGLLNRFADRGWKSLAEVNLEAIRGWLGELNERGELTLCLADGRDLLVHADRRGTPLYLGILAPPYERIAFGDQDLEVDLTRRGAKSRKGAIVCTQPLAALDGDATHAVAWRQLEAGALLAIRQGAVITELSTGGKLETPRERRRPAKAERKTFQVVHRTTYKYKKAVERSEHMLRLTPVHDRLQSVLSSEIMVSVQPSHQRDYEDVFGNRVRRIEIDTPFDEMVIEGKSVVEVLDVDPLGFGPLRVQSTIPLVWMPWQRQLLEPFLLPPELPETELKELVEYAMSFVARNDYDLLDTLLDINHSIYREYAYQQGTTNNLTSAYETYVNRRGVCQDFANLMICLARLLGVPARYVCGYVYTGPKHENVRQGEASHAWVQLYLPQVGWKGFDPTNGILTQTDHVRVAVGRNRADATPTGGTIYVGGGGETLEVDVTCEPYVEGAAAAGSEGGKAGKAALEVMNLAELEAMARARLPQMAWDYYAAGADDERCVRRNCEAFEAIALHYRAMVDVAQRDLTTTVLGQRIAMPVAVAPTAFHRLAHPDGELASVKGAGDAGTIFVLSTLSNTAVEEVVAAATGPVWFQLYVYRDRGATEALVRRVEAAGCKALVLTVDAPLLGRRERDVRNRFALPEGLGVENLFPAGYARMPEAAADSGLAAYVAQLLDPALTWDTIDWLRSITSLPLLVKGIVRADDAVRAIERGAAGVVVSNHGGRQLDASPATIEVLPRIADAVAGRGEILLDGGVRRGTDVLKALANGARAVLVGRPVLWGLAAAGREGVAAALATLRREVDLAMALCGCPDLASVTRDLVQPEAGGGR